MKNALLWTFLIVLFLVPAAQAGTVTFNVDAAPNAYGSPEWQPWWEAAKADVVAGSFVNMRSGTYPGTLDMDPVDEIVYSTGDLGKRLTWIYWIPDANVSNLGERLEVKWVIDWYGYDWTQVGTNWAVDGPEVGWVQPTKWEDYSSGVIGSLGFAWWATDNDALPLDSGGTPYDETDAADIAALRTSLFEAQTFATGYVRIRDDANSPWTTTSLQVSFRAVPVPQAAWLGLAMLASIAGIRRCRRRI